MILIAVISTNTYDYKTFIAGFQFAEGVAIQFKAVVTPHDAQGQNFAGYYLTASAARRPDAVELCELLDTRLHRGVSYSNIVDNGDHAYIEGKAPDDVKLTEVNGNRRRLPYER